MKKVSTVVFLFSLFLISISIPAFSEQRGLQITFKAPSGKNILLYRNSYALVIGNGDYFNDWDPLPGAVKDVDDVAEALRKNGFQVTLKKNLTREGFNQVFSHFCHQHGTELNNRLLFYYAGHGHTRKMATGEDLGYLVMVDAPSPHADPVGFELASVDMQSMVTRAKTINARHVLFMFDSCFSGSILNLREQMVPKSISEAVKLPVRQFITAGRANEPVPDHSIFKVAFLDLLEGRGREPIPDGYITGEELGLYLKNEVPRYNPAQHPQYGKIRDIRLDKGDFVFKLAAREKSPEPPAQNNSQAAMDREMLFWDSIKDSDDPALFKAYLTAFPKGIFAPIAKRRISKVEQKGSVQSAAPYISKPKLFVEVEPVDARVRILNIRPKFRQGMALDPGDYHVEVYRSGYDMEKSWVKLVAGEDRTLRFKLNKFDEPKQSAATPRIKGKVSEPLKDAVAVKAPVSRQPEPTFNNSLGMKFVYIKPGSFMMGSPYGESGRHGDETQLWVTLTKGFYLQTTEVTQGQWERVMGSRPWTGMDDVRESSNNPAVCISWNDCQAFIRKLNRMEGGNKYRLPTETEWEYACRAGAKTRFCFGESDDQLGGYAWWAGNADWAWEDYAHAVGTKRPNAWGLYDMHGNVWEWCQDWYGYYPTGSITDPVGPSTGADRVNRGGSWDDRSRFCRSACRDKNVPGLRAQVLGFRLARTP